ncbi:DNA photolyase family protein [Nonomuraea sp. NBC_01738]|uniref:cryptochrome/photolyase family protein n=1 Tax=Nonomuraea sp. NBC_01738 TaxID=2976003 RepID=UPI002E165660|nr:DNA photolyase family protein [Nonomuraea sp. NBC_01738]
METVIVLFNRDLRVQDHPALSAACERARRVIPLFVLDPAVPAGRRGGFLAACLADLRDALRSRGGDLIVRRGDAVTETLRLAGETSAEAVFTSADVSELARTRQRRLAGAIAVHRFPGVTVVPPDLLRPTGGGDHYRVFTPYWRAWQRVARRDVLPAPGRVPTPREIEPGLLPDSEGPGGAKRAGELLRAWSSRYLPRYGEGHDDLAGDTTSRLSPYLRFGCLSPLELSMLDHAEFTRQLCWRDFYHQVTLAFPRINRDDYRPRGHEWRDDDDALQAWKAGRTGVPIVDAGMRQLLAEGWMHNRARLITASYLAKHLKIDWRVGAAHFFDSLLDGDVPCNYGNWQWVAGTGNDTRPNRAFNPLRQARRFDPAGAYVRRYVPELADVSPAYVHEPWRSPSPVHGYPPPLGLPSPEPTLF